RVALGVRVDELDPVTSASDFNASLGVDRFRPHVITSAGDVAAVHQLAGKGRDDADPKVIPFLADGHVGTSHQQTRYQQHDHHMSPPAVHTSSLLSHVLPVSVRGCRRDCGDWKWRSNYLSKCPFLQVSANSLSKTSVGCNRVPSAQTDRR